MIEPLGMKPAIEKVLGRFLCFDGHIGILPHAKLLWNADRNGIGSLAVIFSLFQAPSMETWVRSGHKQSRETNWFEDYNYIGRNKHGKNSFDKVMKGWKRCVNIEHGVLELKFASSASCCYFAPKFWRTVCSRLVEASCVWLFSWFLEK